MKFKQDLMLFCKLSTIHGLYYVYRSKNWFSRALWMCAVLLCSFNAICLSYKLWLDYYSDPIITAVQNAYYPVKYIPFPNVVICSNALFNFDSPWAKEVKKTIKSHGFNDAVLEEFFNTMTNPTMKLTYEKEVDSVYKNLYNAGIYKSFNDAIDYIRKPCNQMLLQCIWRSAVYNCTDMFYAVYTWSGLCCRFDVDYFRISAPKDININIRSTKETSLQIVLNGEYVTPKGKPVDSRTRFYIFADKEHVSIPQNAVQLSPRVSYDIALSVHEIIASQYVKRLPPLVRKCNLPEIDHTQYYKTCVTNIMLDHLIQHCQCCPYFITNQDNKYEYQNCSWEQYPCIVHRIREFQSSQVQEISMQVCNQPCEDIVYESKIRFNKWNRRRTPVFNTSKDLFISDKRILDITVRFEMLSCFRYIRQVIFTWDQMLANLGGTFSLSIGGSITSVIEIAWLSGAIILSLLKDIYKKFLLKKTLQKTNAWESNELPAIKTVPFAH